MKLSSPGAAGAEIVTSPAIAELDGQLPREVVVATNEVVPGDPQPPGTIFDVFNAFLGSSTGSNPVYAVNGDGSMVSGWPVQVGVLAGDLLPMVLPGNDAAVLDVDGDGNDEVSVSAATSLSGQGPKLVDGDGSTIRTFQAAAANCPDQGEVVNLADYPSVGDLAGDGTPDVVKGGLTLNGVANLLAVNQNLPFCHVEQAWNPATGAALPGYPRATDDFQLLSQASIARVAGGGPQRQALVGTGLYQLHAYGPTGREAPGWPKFTGGWTQSTPAVGDADGNGTLDVAAVTREGWSFLWRTAVPTCGDSNNEWWTFHHDEHGTANYGFDGRPPGTPRSLRGQAQRRRVGARELESARRRLALRQPQRPARYRVIASNDPIGHPNEGRVIATTAATGGAGQAISRTFTRPRSARPGTLRCSTATTRATGASCAARPSPAEPLMPLVELRPATTRPRNPPDVDRAGRMDRCAACCCSDRSSSSSTSSSTRRSPRCCRTTSTTWGSPRRPPGCCPRPTRPAPWSRRCRPASWRRGSARGARCISGLLLLGLASLVFGFAQHVVLLDAARFVQGVAGALAWAGALTWLILATPEERRGSVIGDVLGIAIAGALLGPVARSAGGAGWHRARLRVGAGLDRGAGARGAAHPRAGRAASSMACARREMRSPAPRCCARPGTWRRPPRCSA